MAEQRVEFTIPTEWTPHGSFQGPPLESAVTELWDDEGRCRGALIALRFEDTRFLSLSWPQGTRFARITAATDWALQERFDGYMPADLAGPVKRTWKVALDLLAAAAREARS